MLLEQHSSVCCSRTTFTALTCTTGVCVVVSAGILQAWVEKSTEVLVPVFHLLLVQDCVGLLQGELQRERKPRDTKQGADWLLACLLARWAAGRPLTMSLSACVMVRLVLPPFMIMAVFTSSTSLGARLSRKRLERLVLGFLWDDTGE